MCLLDSETSGCNDVAEAIPKSFESVPRLSLSTLPLNTTSTKDTSSSQSHPGAIRHSVSPVGESSGTSGRRESSSIQNDSQEVSSTNTSDRALYLRDELYRRLREDPTMFDWIQRALGDGLWYWDLENPEVEWYSPECKALFGYSDDEVPNLSSWWQEHIFEEDKIACHKAFENHLIHNKPFSEMFDIVIRMVVRFGSDATVKLSMMRMGSRFVLLAYTMI
jgi:PAS domain-containing protein